MEFDNNPTLEPIKKGLNPLISINQRLNALESKVASYPNEFKTQNLEATNIKAENAEIKNLSLKNQLNVDSLGLNKINEETPIISSHVLGYDGEGKLIPIYAHFEGTDLYDYIVDSQEKFNQMISLASSETIFPYKNVAILAGYGLGDGGAYVYNIDDETKVANFNDCVFNSFGEVKISVNADNTASLVVFKEGTFNGITFDCRGTLLQNEQITLFSKCILNKCKILHYSNPLNIKIEKTNLNDTVNEEYLNFEKCTLENCDTVQSSFLNCSSTLLYVSTDSNIASKYSFNKCGIHMDVRRSDLYDSVSATLNISSIVESNITCLDDYSNNKKITLNIDDADSYSTIVGNDEEPQFSLGETVYDKITKTVPPSMWDKAYILLGDTSFTPVFSEDKTHFYLNADMTHEVRYRHLQYEYNNTTFDTPGFTDEEGTISSSNHFYTDLSFRQMINNITAITTFEITNLYIKIVPKFSKYIKNNVALKTYIVKDENSGTILFSSDDGSTLYLSPTLSQTDMVKKYSTSIDDGGKVVNAKVYAIRINETAVYNSWFGYDLDFKIIQNAGVPTELTPLLSEVSVDESLFNVKVVSPHDKLITVKNAFSIKTE